MFSVHTEMLIVLLIPLPLFILMYDGWHKYFVLIEVDYGVECKTCLINLFITD